MTFQHKAIIILNLLVIHKCYNLKLLLKVMLTLPYHSLLCLYTYPEPDRNILV